MKKLLTKIAGTALILFIGLSLGASSDLISISGNITDSDGESISDVEVVCVQNSSYSTTTNSRGHYQISIPRNTSLSFSKAGFELSSSQDDCPLFSSSQSWDVEMTSSTN